METKRVLAKACFVIALCTMLGGTSLVRQHTAHGASQPPGPALSWERAVLYSAKDAWVNESSPLTKYGQDTVLRIGSGGCNLPASNGRALLYFDLSSIPPQAQISGATLTLLLEESDNVGPDPQASIITVWRVAELWSEHLVSWRMQPAPVHPYGSTSVNHSEVGTWIRWDVTEWVQEIHSGALNYGLMLIANENLCNQRVFSSRETWGCCGKPTLIIEYTLPDATPTPTPTATPTPTPTATPTPVPNYPPENRSLWPDHGGRLAGRRVNFTTSYRDRDGWRDLKQVYLHFGDTTASRDNVMLRYDVRRNRLYINNDAGTGWAGGCAPGSPTTKSNRQCRLHCARTVVTKNGRILTVKWNLQFKATFRGRQNVYLRCTDRHRAVAPWQAMGTWRIR